MSGGREFHAADPACENARSPNLVRSRGVTYYGGLAQSVKVVNPGSISAVT